MTLDKQPLTEKTQQTHINDVQATMQTGYSLQ